MESHCISCNYITTPRLLPGKRRGYADAILTITCIPFPRAIPLITKVISMKRTTLATVFLLFLSGTTLTLAQEPGIQIQPVEAITADTAAHGAVPVTTAVPDAAEQTEAAAEPDTTAPGPGDAGKPCPMHGPGKMRRAMDGPCKTGCEVRTGGCRQDRHREVVERLDLIEARLARIDAMLEALLRR